MYLVKYKNLDDILKIFRLIVFFEMYWDKIKLLEFILIDNV